MRGIKKTIKIFGIILFTVIVTLCIIILYKAYSEPNKIPSVFGWKPFIVLSGSMETSIMTGDLILVKEVDTSKLKEGDVISYRTDNDIVITHRIVDIVEDEGKIKYYTKGDNNDLKDKDPVFSAQIEGIYKYRIPKLGKIASNLQKPIGMIICITFPLILLLIAQFADYKRQEKVVKEKEERQKALEEEMEILKQQNKELMKRKD